MYFQRNEETFKRTVEHIKLRIKELQSKGYTEEQVVEWIEGPLNQEINLGNTFVDTLEMAELLNIPVKKFNLFWML